LKGDDLIQRKLVRIIRHDFEPGVLRWLGSRFSEKPWDTWLSDGNFLFSEH
jgi:hypothetical protein